jgi:hypothetical protein
MHCCPWPRRDHGSHAACMVPLPSPNNHAGVLGSRCHRGGAPSSLALAMGGSDADRSPSSVNVASAPAGWCDRSASPILVGPRRTYPAHGCGVLGWLGLRAEVPDSILCSWLGRAKRRFDRFSMGTAHLGHKTASSARTLIAHTWVVAWLVWVALPWLGELP